MLVTLNKDKNNMKKFLGILILVFMCSSTGIAATIDNPTYLKCGKQYLKLTGNYLYMKYNVRTKKFMKYRQISEYGEVMIYAEGYHLNRDTGEFGYSSGTKKVCEKINFNGLPQLNAEGKKF